MKIGAVTIGRPPRTDITRKVCSLIQDRSVTDCKQVNRYLKKEACK